MCVGGILRALQVTVMEAVPLLTMGHSPYPLSGKQVLQAFPQTCWTRAMLEVNLGPNSKQYLYFTASISLGFIV